MHMGRRRYAAAASLAGALGLSSCHSSTPPPPPPTSSRTPGKLAPAPQAARVRQIATNMAAVGFTQDGRLVYNRRGPDGEWDVYAARPDLSGQRCVTCSL